TPATRPYSAFAANPGKEHPMSEHSLQVNVGTVDGAVPAPSQEAIDSWFATFGGVILGAVLAIGSAIAGAAILTIARPQPAE
ncbi:MAG: hypothetical protein AB1762_19280, partial [Gemmatimonadota bacterium]